MITTATIIDMPIVASDRRLRAASARSPSPIAVLIIEYLLDPQVEQSRDSEGERQRGIVLARLDRIHRLARHAEPAAKLGLTPVAFGAQHLQPVVHRSPVSRFDLTLCQDNLT